MLHQMADGHCHPGDQRTHRRRALKQGTISYADGAITVECQVRDQTEEGAKLRLLSPEPVPNHFDLFVPIDGLSKRCLVRWRQADHIGVEFTAEAHHRVRKRNQVVTEGERDVSIRRR